MNIWKTGISPWRGFKNTCSIVERPRSSELGSPRTTLTMKWPQTDRMDLGEWDTSVWEKELFPRYNCERMGWPKQLEMVWKAFSSSRVGPRRVVSLHIWDLDAQCLGVLITNAHSNSQTSLHDSTFDAAITIPRSSFPDLEEGPK